MTEWTRIALISFPHFLVILQSVKWNLRSLPSACVKGCRPDGGVHPYLSCHRVEKIPLAFLSTPFISPVHVNRVGKEILDIVSTHFCDCTGIKRYRSSVLYWVWRCFARTDYSQQDPIVLKYWALVLSNFVLSLPYPGMDVEAGEVVVNTQLRGAFFIRPASPVALLRVLNCRQ